MKVIILAGGLGTRLTEETTIKPKPMVEIGGRPILWHIMKIYAHYGHDQFGIAMGYKAESIKNYFLNYYYQQCNVTIQLKNGQVEVHDSVREDWTVYLADTGASTQTGGRLRRLVDWIGGETFMMTYGDGVANIDVDRLLRFHREKGKLVTVTAVRPPSRFGGLALADNLVIDFEEKSQIGEGWINGGFFVIEPQALDYIEGDETIWERKPLERLAQEGQLAAYQHDGFWQCMDNIRDVHGLENLWQSGAAPWKLWP
jgi:glucose-1-phosphate cytidylyltransferase